VEAEYETRPFHARRIRRRLVVGSLILVPVGTIALSFSMWIDRSVQRDRMGVQAALRESWQTQAFGPGGSLRPTYQACRFGGAALVALGLMEAMAAVVVIRWFARTRPISGSSGCPECSQPVFPDDEFCSACGRQLRCAGCGHLRAAIDGPCAECGRPESRPFRC
jgi:hypothetical protein